MFIRKWIWASPDSRTENEIDKKEILQDVSVLSGFSIGHDNLIIRIKVVINGRENAQRLLSLETVTLFQNEISKTLGSTSKYKEIQMKNLSQKQNNRRKFRTNTRERIR